MQAILALSMWQFVSCCESSRQKEKPLVFYPYVSPAHWSLRLLHAPGAGKGNTCI